MTINELVVSREIGEKLKSAGWNKPTAFVWIQCRDGDDYEIHEHNYDCEKMNTAIPAPTAEELLAELPASVIIKSGEYWLSIYKWRIGSWQIQYSKNGKILNTTVASSLAEAAARMWLWCVEHNYIQSPSANRGLK